MSSQLGPVEVECDAPPYPIVRECGQAGIRSPEDVRWLRMSAYQTRPPRAKARRPGLIGLAWFFRRLFRRFDRQPVGRTCTCGSPLPDLMLLVFTFPAGDRAGYLIGQCPRCRGVYWDAA